jgi:hypothetical protein
MSKLRTFLSSLLIAASLSTVATAKTAVAPKPDIIDVSTKLDRAKVRAKLAERRKVVIERFLAYREARVYPWNRQWMVPQPQHLWFDNEGNLCAAATLISYDWGRESTMKVGLKDRGIALAKIKRGELADWILTSGLTRHEIVAIQVPSIGVEEPEMRSAEIARLYSMYIDVERQLTTLSDENLDLATDALMKRPELAKKLLAGKLPGPGKFTATGDEELPIAPPAPRIEPAVEPVPEPAA